MKTMEDMILFLADVFASFFKGGNSPGFIIKALEMQMGVVEESFRGILMEDDYNNSMLIDVLRKTNMSVIEPRKLLNCVNVGGSCPICLQELEAGQCVGCLVLCCHHFHKHCIDKWLLVNNSCPICRRHINGLI
ncbi:NEP1-interacting protein-like 1 [Bienertia sinuspersici]